MFDMLSGSFAWISEVKHHLTGQLNYKDNELQPKKSPLYGRKLTAECREYTSLT